MDEMDMESENEMPTLSEKPKKIRKPRAAKNGANGTNGHAKKAAPNGATKKGKPNGHAKKSKRNGHAKLAAAPKKRGKQARDDLKISDMTTDEVRLLRAIFTPKGERVGKSLKDLEAKVFDGTKDSGTSKTRNTLRRLVKFGWIEKAERGTYRLTEKGRKRGLKAD